MGSVATSTRNTGDVQRTANVGLRAPLTIILAATEGGERGGAERGQTPYDGRMCSAQSESTARGAPLPMPRLSART